MFDPLANSFYAGILMLLAGFCGLARHFLLEPAMDQFPKAPQWLLHVYFVFATVLIFIGLRFMMAWYLGEPGTPPNATPTGVLLAINLFMYKSAMFYNVLRQRYPAAVWNRLNNITTLVQCSPRSKGK